MWGEDLNSLEKVWHVEDSSLRLFISPLKKGEDLLLFLPRIDNQPLSGGWQAFALNGESIPVVNNRTSPASLTIFSATVATPLEGIFLYAVDTTEPQNVGLRDPYCYHLAIQDTYGMVHPRDGDEMKTYLRSQELTWGAEIPLPKYPNSNDILQHGGENWRKKNYHHSRGEPQLLIRLRTRLVIRKKGEYQFAFDHENAPAFYLFVGEDPVFCYLRSTIEEGKICSAYFPLDVGIYPLTFYFFYTRRDQWPQFYWRSGEEKKWDLPRGGYDLLPPSSPLLLGIQKKTYPLWGIEIQYDRVLFFSETEEKALPLTIVPFNNSQFFEITWNQQSWSRDRQTKSRIFMPLKVQNLWCGSVDPNQYGFSSLQWDLWVGSGILEAKPIKARIVLHKLPIFLPDRPWTLSFEWIGSNECFSIYEGKFSLHVIATTFDHRRIPITQKKLVFDPWDWNISLPPWDPNWYKIDLQIFGDKIPVSLPISIYQLLPQNIDNIQEKGGPLLRFQSGYAILPRHLPIAINEKRPPIQWEHGVWLDDGLFSNVHPLEEWDLSQGILQAPIRLSFVSMSPHGSGDYPIFRKLQMLFTAIQTKPDVILWSTGWQELSAGLSPQDYKDLLLFVLHVMELNRVDIVLITMPVTPTFSQSRQRELMLLTKEIALYNRIPVIDLYSYSLRNMEMISRFWEISQESSQVILETLVPSVLFRQKMFQFVCDELKEQVVRRKSQQGR